MRRALFLIAVICLFMGCGTENWNLDPLPDWEANQKARDEFLKHPTVRDFHSSGIVVDCDFAICSQVPKSALALLEKYKPQFIQRKDRIRQIMFFRNARPAFDDALKCALLPARLTDELLTGFFFVWDSIRAFEEEVGFRIEFPNHSYFKPHLLPLLQTLKDNKSSLQKVADRIDVLVVDSYFNRFYPAHRLLMLKANDLRKSFSELWSFMGIFFKAQDLFGNVAFHFEKGDSAAEKTMNILFNNVSTFAPLISHLQRRSIDLVQWQTPHNYFDAQIIFLSDIALKDLAISSLYDENYLREVFQDQVRLKEISNFIGTQIYHTDPLVDLRGREECFQKLDSLKSQLKEKVFSISRFLLSSSQMAPNTESKYQVDTLYLNCNEPLEKLEAVVNSIN